MQPIRGLAELQNDIVIFFNNSKTKTAAGGDSDNYGPQGSHNRLSIFEMACLGNPEKTIQGELLCYLRSLNWNVVQEAGYLHTPGIKRNFDFVVFDTFNGDKQILCVVEIKHFSANQGSSVNLSNGLDIDYLLPRPSVPLMQIGVYTVVNGIYPVLVSPYVNGLYRFVNTYCRGGLPPRNDFLNIFGAWQSGKNWLHPVNMSSSSPTQTDFKMALGNCISGYVEYFVGVRN
ncbi:hypothetical protein [Massilia glaciei]|uniref:hypothetical protein n=1 Tax=Massilia glaciei TaxID=1524097 RepID=UPI0011B224E8|nr:hypothetical protein [Massilia glaciei]